MLALASSHHFCLKSKLIGNPYLQWLQDEALILPNESSNWEIDKSLARGELAELIYEVKMIFYR